MKTGIPIKVATHVVNYDYIEQLTWERCKLDNDSIDHYQASDGIILAKSRYNRLINIDVSKLALDSGCNLMAKDMRIFNYNTPSKWLLPNPDKTSDYDFSDCGNYFIYECSSIRDKIILVNEAMKQGYSLLPSFNTNTIEMQVKQTMKFE